MEDIFDSHAFAEFIRRERKAQRLTLRDVSVWTERNYTIVQRAEKGESVPTIENALRILDALGFNPEMLVQFCRQAGR